MPEYSSTTITPADAVQTPAMNGSTSGNYNLAALRSYILASKGQANGLASLDANGKLPSGQLPDLADDVLVYDSYATLPAQGESGKIYITADNNKMYRWDSNSSDYVELSVDLSAYATKAEVNALSARVSNLEQKAGDYSIVQYRGTNAVPTGKAKYGLVDKIVGKPRGWNQLAKAMNSTNWQFTNATGSFSDGVATFTATATRGNIGMNSNDRTLPNVANKNVLISVMVKTTTATTSVNLYAYGGYCVRSCVSSTSWQRITAIVTTSASWGYDLTSNNRATVEDARTGSWDAIQVKDWVVRDLSLIAPEFTPSGNVDNDVASLVQQIPDLLKSDAYDAGSLVDTVVSGVESVGVNIWDEVFESGKLNVADGSDEVDGSTIRTKNYLPVAPNTDYYFLMPSAIQSDGIYTCWYDVNKNWIRTNLRNSANGIVGTSPSNGAYLRFFLPPSYGTTYNNDIQICLNSYADKTTYHPYQRNTLTLSTPVTLRSAGSVAEVLDVETGKKTRPIGSVDLGDYNWGYSSGCMISGTLSDVGTVGSVGSSNNSLCAKYTTKSSRAYSDSYSNYECGLSVQGNQIVIKDPNYGSGDESAFKTAMSGVYFYYELATPLSDEQVCDPIPDNYIEVQAGGTINTIQSQTPVIDNCLDVGYLAV